MLKSDKARASRTLPRAVAAIREIWEPRTAENLGSILDARRARGEDVSWLEPIVTQLSKR